ncbi:hypothetical protein HDU67_002861 [Dinochytrium kinnereticum]|nr:hypothetical protein HDU67_002861 [Dinochytrium kinnereticum]
MTLNESIPVQSVRKLVSLQDLVSADPLAVLNSMLSQISRAKESEGRQFGLLGQLLVFKNRISHLTKEERSIQDILPSLYMIVEDAEDSTWSNLTTEDFGGRNVLGFMVLERPRLVFWFRDGPGEDEEGNKQRALVKMAIGDAFRALHSSKVSTTDLAEEQLSGFVFLYCVDVRYVPIAYEISKKDWDEEAYGVYELPHAARFENVKQLGDVWTDPSTGETYEMTTVNMDDYDQVREYSTVDYPTPYLNLLLTQEPLVNLSRAIRVKIPNSSSTKGTMVAWIISHANLSLGLLSTVLTHRRRGLANICIESLVTAQRDFIAAEAGGQREIVEALIPYCFISDKNHASQSLFKRVGFVRSPCPMRSWVGVQV